MIRINKNEMEFRGGGRFLTDLEWIHPDKTEITYELIYVTDGDVFLEMGSQQFHLVPQDLIILPPGIPHRGYETSHGRTSFYWIHFKIDDLEEFASAGIVYRPFSNSFLLKELLHFHNSPACPPVMTDIVLSHILAQLAYERAIKKDKQAKLAAEIAEYIRINAGNTLSAAQIGKVFGYHEEYLTRLMKQNYGQGLKFFIDAAILSKAKELLSHSNFSVKEIAAALQFSSANSFIHFYKYHEKITPNRYRNTYAQIHMNNK